MDVQAAQQRWEMENNVQLVETDARYKFDIDAYIALRGSKPWKKDPLYFKKVRISAVALIKMAMHAVSGDNLEIMGLLVGFVEGDTMFVVDSFELPVVGVEYQVNPGAKCDVFLTQFRELNEQVGKNFATIGWYHSHPGLGVFLSKVDVETETLYQQFQEPFLAVVIDPKRTMNAGKVEIGAFRVYPPDYEPPAGGISSKYRIPLDRVEEFGAQAKLFYRLEIGIYKSSTEARMLELLWTKYWRKTLSTSPHIVGRSLACAQLEDIAKKVSHAESKIVQGGRHSFMNSNDKTEDSPLADVAEEGSEITLETLHGMMNQVLKDSLFNRLPFTQ